MDRNHEDECLGYKTNLPRLMDASIWGYFVGYFNPKIRLTLAFKEYNKNNKASIYRQTAILNITLDASTNVL